MAQWWYNSSYHSAIKKSPFEVLFGYPAPLLPALMNPPIIVPAMEEYLQQRQKVTQLLKKQLTTTHNWMTQVADRRRSDQEFNIGDRVYLKVKRFL